MGKCCLHFISVRAKRELIRNEETLHSEQQIVRRILLNQAKQKGGNLPTFHGSRFQQGYGLGSIFKGLFRWAMPHLQQDAKVLGKKALQTGVQDVLDGDHVNTALAKRSREAIGELVPQPGSGRKSTKRKVQFRGLSPGKKRKTIMLEQGQDDFELWP